MKLLDFLHRTFSSLLPSSEIPSLQFPPAPLNHLRLSYEGFVPLDAVVFYIGAYTPSEGLLDKLVANVISASRIIKPDEDTMDGLANLSTLSDAPGRLGQLVKTRNELLNIDKSGIMRGLVREHAEGLRRSMESGLHPQTIQDGDRGPTEKRYVEMVKRLKIVIEESGNITRALERERDEFYRRRVEIPDREVLRAKISISLAGYLVSTHSLPALTKRLSGPNRDVKIVQWVRRMMRSAEELEMRTSTKSAFERKMMVKEFLESCLSRKNADLDELFEMRSSMLMQILRDRVEVEKENVKQERHIRWLLRTVEGMSGEEWIVRYNRDIADEYTNFLLSGLGYYKKRLLAHFGW